MALPFSFRLLADNLPEAAVIVGEDQIGDKISIREVFGLLIIPE